VERCWERARRKRALSLSTSPTSTASDDAERSPEGLIDQYKAAA